MATKNQRFGGIEGKGAPNFDSIDSLEEESRKGNPEAKITLSKVYAIGEGFGVEADQEKAIQLLKEAANLGNSEAQWKLSLMLASSLDSAAANSLTDGLPREEIEKLSLNYAKMSAEQGDFNGYFSLGSLYARGIGVEQNPEEALKYYLLAALNGNRLTQEGVAKILTDGSYGVEKNEIEALKIWKNLADEEVDEDVCKIVSEWYAQGRGNPGSSIESWKYYFKPKLFKLFGNSMLPFQALLTNVLSFIIGFWRDIFK